MSEDGPLKDTNNISLFRPHDSSWLKNKFYYYNIIRQMDSLYYSKEYNLFVITDYYTVINILKDYNTYGSSHGNLVVENPERFGNTLGASDPPTHDEYKNTVKYSYSKEFSEDILKNIKSLISAQLSDSKNVNITSLSILIASTVVAKLLGLPEPEEKVVKAISHIQNNSAKCVKFNTSEKGYNALVTMISKNLVTKVSPKTSGIYKEYISNSQNKKNISLFTGPTLSGAASLAGAIQFITLDLFRNNKLDSLIADKSLIPNAVQESLRYNASTGRFTRTANKTTVVKNTEIPANSRLVVCLDAASRDPEVFSDPDIFNLNRSSNPHLAFGHGIHACIALYLSKIILEFFLDSLLSNYGKYMVIDIDNLNYTITQSGNNDMISNLIIEKYV